MRATIEELEARRLFTVLLFEPVTGSFASGGAMPQTYGDRVTAVSQNGYHYATTGGTTPNILAAYGTYGPAVVARSTGYGDLKNVAATSGHAIFEMTLTADKGFKATLASFDLAGSPSHDWTIKKIAILDGNNNIMFSQTNVKIEGDASGVRHTHFTFAKPLTASLIKIRFDASNLTGTASVGLDNVQFGQIVNAPPPPAPAKISGTAFNDVNRDGVHAASGEPGLAGWRVFLDTNNDGLWQSTETSVLTDSSGNYTFSVPAGSYHVAEVVPSGWKQIAPTGSYPITAAAGQNVTGRNFADAQVITQPVISVGSYTASTNSTVTLKLMVSDAGNITAQDIEGMSFTIQIDSGNGTAPTIQSVDLLTGTVWAGHNAGAFVPSGGSQPQFKTYSVLTGSDGDFINPNGLLATIVLNTAGAAAGNYSIKLIGTKLPAFDTQFENHVGAAVSSVVTNGTLTIKQL